MSFYIFYCSLILYLASTVSYLLYLVVYKRIVEQIGYYTLISGLVVHLLATILRYIQAGYTPITNFHEALSFLALSIACVFLYMKREYKIDTMGSIIVPTISLLLIWASFYPSDIKPLPPVLKSYWLPIHTIFSFVGNAIFFIGFFVSVMYLITERSVKQKRSSALSHRLPSLEILDRVNYRCIAYGFPFLTIGIISGSIWAGFAWGSYWSWDPKETWSLITWIVYAILIHNRLAIGWRGRKTAYMMIIGFLSILFTFFGVNLLLGGLHAYI